MAGIDAYHTGEPGGSSDQPDWLRSVGLPVRLAEFRPTTVEAGGLPGSDRSPAPDLTEQLKQFSALHHVDVAAADGQLNYSLRADGRREFLFQTSADTAGLSEAERLLSRRAQDMETQMSKRYGVTFSTPGEEVEPQRGYVYSKPSDHMVKARSPELYELIGIDAALARSEPSNRDESGKPLKIYFLAEQPVLDVNAIATFQYDRKDYPSIYVWPFAGGVRYSTEKDLPAEQQKMSFSDRLREETIEGTVTHELGHFQFAKLGYNTEHTSLVNDVPLSQSGEQLAKMMGWTKNQNTNVVDVDWLVNGKSISPDGKQASYLPYVSGGNYTFTRWRPTGGEENSLGAHVPGGQGERFNLDEMRENALVTPPTWYFLTPQEEYAESVKLFRLGDDARQSLLKTSSPIYDIIKSNDQVEINLARGTNSDGTPKFMRDWKGQVVAVTPEVQLRTQQMESAIKNGK
jgi:hypothetical protein